MPKKEQEPDFEGWELTHRHLISPEGLAWTPGDIRAFHWHWQQVSALKLRIRKLEHILEHPAQLDAFEGWKWLEDVEGF